MLFVFMNMHIFVLSYFALIPRVGWRVKFLSIDDKARLGGTERHPPPRMVIKLLLRSIIRNSIEIIIQSTVCFAEVTFNQSCTLVTFSQSFNFFTLLYFHTLREVSFLLTEVLLSYL